MNYKKIKRYSVLFEITKKCNWKCIFCYAECNNKDILSTEDIKKIIDDLYNYGVIDLTFTGGEPLMRNDAFEIFNYAKKKGFALTLYTNGSLINENNINMIKELFGSVEVSLHSHDSNTHDIIVKNGGAWKKTVAAVEMLKRNNIKVCIKCVLTKYEISNILKFKDYVEKELNVEFNVDIDICDTYSGCDAGRKANELNEEQLSILKNQVPLYYYGFDVEDFIIKGRKFPGRCRAGDEILFIDANANLYPCIQFKKNGMEIIDGVHWVENLLDKKIDDIINNNILFNKIRQLREQDFVTCNNCQYDSLCQKCIGQNYVNTENLCFPDNKNCYKTIKKFNEFIERR